MTEQAFPISSTNPDKQYSHIQMNKGQFVVNVAVDGAPILFKIRGKPWCVADDAEPWQIADAARALCGER